MKAKLFILLFGILGVAAQVSANEKIYVNSEVTTHIVMPENIKLVDIPTAKIVGNQCTDNIVRIKPYLESDSLQAVGSYKDNELLGTITLIGERHIAQYDILYTPVSYKHLRAHENKADFVFRLLLLKQINNT